MRGWVSLALVALACASTQPGPAAAPSPAPVAPPAAEPELRTRAASPAKQTAAPLVASAPHCPAEMALVRRAQGYYCIDRWEGTIERLSSDGRGTPHPGNQRVDGMEKEIVARSQPGKKPQGYISGVQAAAACERAGKRLCEIDEWVTACRGPKRTIYPYGDKRKANVCNDRFRKLDNHPVVRLFNKHAPAETDSKLMWHPSWMNDSRLHEMDHSVVPTGAFKACTNDYGVFDMVGNLHEWVADAEGTFFGGYLMDTYQNGEGCEYRTIFHPHDYHDYSTGFRCCRDADFEGGKSE